MLCQSVRPTYRNVSKARLNNTVIILIIDTELLFNSLALQPRKIQQNLFPLLIIKTFEKLMYRCAYLGSIIQALLLTNKQTNRN